MRIPIALAAQLQSSLASSSSGSVTGEILSISGPSTLRSCIPSTFHWTPTSGPYTLSLIDHTTSEDVEDMVLVTETKATWMVDISPGSNITLLITDSKGNSAESLNWVVEEGTTGCLGDLN
ncbi:hypothetical protein L486_00144 [Kwoniella mangroviensis CBS 10435]|uniref:Uncharacterized protein n=1 Tax=Kwoniella mangroviensis CBS 10435 TaxID=1331196 RepID=A0A1B9IYB0_9TREE|nr:hypothetical protein L486_00144 [Kwoniella mangroviensis CBS 10435]OCF74741.1 hypothetical protein I204_05123 [Kwoniella mangroviensis CBS 8886]